MHKSLPNIRSQFHIIQPQFLLSKIILNCINSIYAIPWSSKTATDNYAGHMQAQKLATSKF
eukprot:c41224_g1_i1 orf=29-211(-)